MQPQPSPADALQRLRGLLSSRLALDCARRSAGSLQQILVQQAALHRCSTLASYGERLQAQREDGPLWSSLIEQLTIAETYFFRDSGQMELLRDTLLPRLARTHDQLRIWSAGCSTGEEPYTLAILLDQLGLRERSHILGTDLSQSVLERARAALYGERSLRSTPLPLRQLYFHPERSAFRLEERLRRQVSFERDNLADTSQPPPTTGSPSQAGFDLILCRNVLIYFERSRLQSVLDRFVRSLRPGGALLCGHGELHQVDRGGLETEIYPGSVIYRRPGPGKAQAGLPGRPAPVSPTLRSRVEKCWRRGDLEGGRDACREAAARQPLAAIPRLLEARLARAQERWTEAGALAQQAVYLAPQLPQAYLELALAQVGLGERGRALKTRQTALALLREASALEVEGILVPEQLGELERSLGPSA